MDEFKNPNGTYNGAKALAALSGLSEEEIKWTWERAKQLKAQGLSGEQLKRALRMETRDKFGKQAK